MASPFVARPLYLQVAEALALAIRRHELGDPLPGEIPLSARMGVSRPVLRRALAHLAARGVVEIAQGKRTRIARGEAERLVKTPRVLLLGPGPVARPDWGESATVVGIRERLAKKRWILMEQVDPAFRSSRAPAMLRELVERNRPTLLLLLGSTPAMQQWAQGSGIPSLVLGSQAQGCALPSIDVHYQALGRHGAGRFLTAGKEDLTAFITGRMRVGDQLTIDGMNEALAQAGRPPVNVCVIRSPLEAFLRQLDRAIRPGAGWIFLSPGDALTAYTYLLSTGRRMPREVALLSRNAFPMIRALYPTLAHYQTDDRRMILKTVAMMEAMIAEPEVHPGVVRLLPRFVPGQTLLG